MENEKPVNLYLLWLFIKDGGTLAGFLGKLKRDEKSDKIAVDNLISSIKDKPC